MRNLGIVIDMARAKGTLTPELAMAGALAALRRADPADPANVRAAISEATQDLENGLEGKEFYSRAAARRLLGVSTPTLAKWVRAGLLPLNSAPGYKRKMIPAGPLLELAGEVRELRRMGRNRGLLAEALSRLEQEDPRFTREFSALYGAPLAAKDEFVSAAPGPVWDPEDESDPNALDFDQDD
jgi:hypothetical protein